MIFGRLFVITFLTAMVTGSFSGQGRFRRHRRLQDEATVCYNATEELYANNTDLGDSLDVLLDSKFEAEDACGAVCTIDEKSLVGAGEFIRDCRFAGGDLYLFDVEIECDNGDKLIYLNSMDCHAAEFCDESEIVVATSAGFDIDADFESFLRDTTCTATTVLNTRPRKPSACATETNNLFISNDNLSKTSDLLTRQLIQREDECGDNCTIDEDSLLAAVGFAYQCVNASKGVIYEYNLQLKCDDGYDNKWVNYDLCGDATTCTSADDLDYELVWYEEERLILEATRNTTCTFTWTLVDTIRPPTLSPTTAPTARPSPTAAPTGEPSSGVLSMNHGWNAVMVMLAVFVYSTF